MDLYDAPTLVTRVVAPRAGLPSRARRIAVVAVMLMLFELGFALGGYRARRTPVPLPPPPVTAVARPAPIVIPPRDAARTPGETHGSVVRSDGARVHSELLEEDRALR